MAYEDDKTLFPTRSGQATGTANERTMLDNIGGANGIRHSQREAVDGTVTHLKTRAGNPEFWNEPIEERDEPESIYMDSGAVDLLSVNPNDPRSVESSPIYYASLQQKAYADKVLLGKIKPPSIKNSKPPEDGAVGKSFKAVEGGDLVGKKDCAAKCPPSMFTGKARLYAQAQLGTKLKMWKWELNLDTFPPCWKRVEKDENDNDVENTFQLDINTGIYTDANNAHWLIQIRGDGVIVTKLVVSDEAKPLLRKLKNPKYAADKDKIEAYILGYSAPSKTVAFGRFIDGLPPPYMLGYGWKFNWSGSCADIIKHAVGVPQHESTHYRLSINRNMAVGIAREEDRWTFALSVVEGPVYWHTSMYADVIAYPDWTLRLLTLFGTKYGDRLGNAPVYCFYKEDGELEVIRYSGTGGKKRLMRSGVSEPASWMWVFDWTEDPYAVSYPFEGGTLALAGGYGERRARTEDPSVTGFYSSRFNCVESEQSYTFDSQKISEKSWTGNYHVLSNGISYDAYLEEGVATNGGMYVIQTASDGVEVFTNHNIVTTNTGSSIGRAIGSDVFDPELSCIRETRSGVRGEMKDTLLVIPFYDAEAAYVHCKITTSESSTGVGGECVGYCSKTYLHFLDNVFQVPGSNPVAYTRVRNTYYGSAGAAYQPAGASNVLDPVNKSTDRLIFKGVITRSGVYDFTPPISLTVFFSGVDFVEQNFHTTSAIHGPMYGFGAKNPDGITHGFDSPPPFIGWA